MVSCPKALDDTVSAHQEKLTPGQVVMGAGKPTIRRGGQCPFAADSWFTARRSSLAIWFSKLRPMQHQESDRREA